MSNLVITVRIVDSTELVTAIEALLQACRGREPDDRELAEQRIRKLRSNAMLSGIDNSPYEACDIASGSTDDGTSMEFSLTGGASDTYAIWEKWQALLVSLGLAELCYVLSSDASGTVDVYLSNATEVATYTTECGGRSDAKVVDAVCYKDRFDRLWELNRAGKLLNSNKPKVGPICAQVLVKMGHVEKGSEQFNAIRKLKDVYRILAEVFPERTSEISPHLGTYANELLELLQAYARAAPEWDLQDASIQLQRRDEDDDDEYPTHDVVIRFRSFGDDHEWSFEHRPYIEDREIYKRISQFAARYLDGQFLRMHDRCMYPDPAWHSSILRALAPPDRVLEIIRRNDHNAFYSLYDTIGYMATALAFQLPGRGRISPQAYMDEHPENGIAQTWKNLN